MAFLKPRKVAHAHCDLMCGVYNPAQARIEAESVKAIAEKYQASDDEVFRQRAVFIKEQRAEMAKHHLWVLWTDYFKPPHVEQFPLLDIVVELRPVGPGVKQLLPHRLAPVDSKLLPPFGGKTPASPASSHENRTGTHGAHGC